MEEKKMTLAEYGKKLQEGEGITPIKEESEVFGEETKSTETVSINTSASENLDEIEVFDPKDASKFIPNMQRVANLSERGGIIPAMNEEEIADMNKKLEGAETLYMKYTENDAREAIEVLRRHGYTDAEIDEIPYLKLLSLGKALLEDEKAGTVGDMKDKVDENGNVDMSHMNEEVTGSGLKKVDETVRIDSAVAGVQSNNPNPTVIDKDGKDLTKEEEDEIIDKSLNEMLDANKKVYIKYADKPLNSYRRAKESKAKKLLSRQKRGNKVEVFLPNSNLMLEVFEIHQPMIINEVMTLTQMSQDIMAKKRVVEAILERSTPMCSDGDEITVDGMMNYISYDDLGYIYLAAAYANTIGEVPYGVRCEKCGTQGTIKLDIPKLFAKAIQDIPDDVKASYDPSDNFAKCIEKSLANKIIEVKDKDARVVVTLSNPSLLSNCTLGQAIKTYICDAFASMIPEQFKFQSIDTKFDFLANLESNEIMKTVSACVILSYIEKVDIYTFEGGEDNWDNPEFLDASYDSDEDGVDLMIETMLSLEKSTMDIIEKTIEKEYIRARIELDTGAWSCPNEKCKAINSSRVEGLELLILSLSHKMEESK
ncbi:hypothetical protein JDFnp4_15 [Fusobacterium phage JD-Fnp4]|nr:hypothetical protein JDFnp4_15 [Fusobacterium phage JD-Fnp4]